MEKEVETKTEEVKEPAKKSKKGLLITLIVICSLLLAGLISCLVIIFIKPDFLHGFGEKKITITFDSDGGTEVEKITFVKGNIVKLPIPTKEGNEFKGWIIVDVKEDEYFKKGSELTDYWTKILSDDITVKAKWEELKEDEMIMTIIFNGKGGKVSGNNSNDSQSVVKCKDNAYTVEGLPTASKDGYRFMAWADEHGTPILEGALLTCTGTLNLYATYEKKEEPKPEPTKPVEKEKKYTCPEGFELKDNNKCVSQKTPEYYCETGKESNGTGSKVCYTWASEPTNKTCKNGGTYISRDHADDLCGYEEVTRLTGNVSGCTNEVGGQMYNNHCYKRVEVATSSNVNYSCPGTSAYRTSAELGNTANSGCYNLSQRTYGCKNAGEGYSMNYTTGKCVKTIDATLE
ncbi:MAG: InlB B-repeat-containing protein [Bacilli bacterium]|nr:InlB B-repeat-containing protein [Bacilli bacterium]